MVLNDKNPPMVYLVPRWIFQALTRNGFSLDQLLNAVAIKKCASTTEIAELAILNESVYVNGCVVSNSVTFNGVTEDGEDVNKLIAPLRYDEAVKAALMSSLDLPAENGLAPDSPDSKSYEMVLTQYALNVVVDPGFLTQVKNADFSKDFLRNLVMTLSRTLSVDKLASYPFYGSYLRTLRA